MVGRSEGGKEGYREGEWGRGMEEEVERARKEQEEGGGD